MAGHSEIKLKTCCMFKFSLEKLIFQKIFRKIEGPFTSTYALKYFHIYFIYTLIGSKVNNRGQNFMNNRALKNKAASNLYYQIYSRKLTKILQFSALPLKYIGSKFKYCGRVL